MLSGKEEILIDYLDNRLQGEELLSAEKMLQEDAAAAEQLAQLRFSVALVREAAVNEQVTAARTNFQQSAKVVAMPRKEAAGYSFSKTALRIAASVLILLGAATVYKYSSVSAGSVYENNFTSFELSTSRGNNADGELEKAYRNKNWKAVQQLETSQKVKTAKSVFLTGMANMEQKEYNEAIVSFNDVLALNQHNKDPYFQDEAEYYLALSYLGANRPAEGAALLQKIREDNNHLFHQKAASISGLDLKILAIKK